MMKIPLIIIHRLRMKARELKKYGGIMIKKDKSKSLQNDKSSVLLKKDNEDSDFSFKK